MKKTLRQLIALGFVLFCSGLVSVMAQNRSVTGKVTDSESGSALPGVNVFVKGTTVGTATNANGNYMLSIPENADSLVFSYIGYNRKSVAIDGNNTINVRLTAKVQELNNVVVTAFGIKQQRPSLGYEVPEVSGKTVSNTKQENVVSALQGQIAGVQVTGSGGAPGSSSRIVIRGINSLDPSSNNQPLFVVDGVPIDNSSNTGGIGSEDYATTNMAADINPDDIASITVLKSGAATALYGIRAANGAVIITTKHGHSGQTKVNYSSSVGFQQVDKYPKLQKKYLAGWYGKPDYKSYPFPFHAWGPKADTVAGAQFYNNFRNFFAQGGPGLKVNNDINVSGGTNKTTFFVSAARLHQRGIVPNTFWNRTNGKVAGSVTIADNFHVNGSVNYIFTKDRNAYQPTRELVYYPTSEDVTHYLKPDGTQYSYTPWLDNPIYAAYHHYQNGNVNRMIGNVGLNWQMTDWLDVNYKLGNDFYNDSRKAILPGPQGISGEIPLNAFGNVQEISMNNKDVTSTLIITANKQINKKLSTTLRVGNDVYSHKYNRLYTEGSNFAIPNFFNLSNTSTITSSEYTLRKRVVGVYGDFKLNYDDMFYFTLTGRNDWSSTLPKNNRSFFYPSVSVGYIVSRMFKLPKFFDYAKLRASWAKVGKDAPAYATGITYVAPGNFPFKGLTGVTKNDVLGDPNLKPEMTNSFEVGTDLRFLKDRVTFNFTWYNQDSKDQILHVPVSTTTGYATFVTNAGEIRNRGVELSLSVRPVETHDFSWDISGNFTKNNNRVVSIRKGIDNITLNGSLYTYGGAVYEQLFSGMPYGNILGTSYKRYYKNPANEDPLKIDKSRPLLIGPDGFPERNLNYKILGNVNPDWTAGITNNFRYKNVDLSFLIDIKQGGDVVNQPAAFFAAQGTLPITANRDQEIVFKGVTADGKPNTKKVWLGQGTHNGVNYGDGYYRNIYRKVGENFVQHASWVRLRNLTLTYHLPNKIFRATPLSRASVSLTGNNLLLFTPYSGFDPESSAFGAGSNTQGFQGRGTPAVRSFTLTLNLSI
ncbi:MAG TPA: SusC/RagA family TonB-linked outer membrane protein [Balneolales bacterium]|nr:SusC/RagA family TonB-linked outer membrane protein [Balneolales bacterium]